MDTTRLTYRLIKDAYRLLGRKRFTESIAILEGVLASGVGHIYVLLLLAVGYLGSGQFGKLARFLAKMKDMDPRYLPLVQLEAFLKLKSAATREEALRIYIDLSAAHPEDPHINRGRRLLAEADDFPAFQKSARLQDFVHVPSPPRDLLKKRTKDTAYVAVLSKKKIRILRDRRRRVAAAAVVLAAAAAAGWGIARMAGSVNVFRTVGRTPGPADARRVDMVTVTGTDYELVRTMKPGAVPVYYRSAADMTADFNRARVLIKQGKYNRALYILNGIAHSNVNFVVKEKVDFLVRFVMDQDEREYEELSCREAAANAYRYLGYAVRWKGLVKAAKRRGEGLATVVVLDGTCESPDIDLFIPRAVDWISVGSRIIFNGVITGRIGKENRLYVTAHDVSPVK